MSELTPNLKLFKYDPVADAKQPLDITKAWNNNWDILDKNTGGVPIGMIYPAILGIDESENKYRYLNGQIIVQEQFINFTNWLKSKLKTASNMFTTEQNWQAEKTASKLGQCGKFVVDDTAGTIRLPLVININGLTDLANCGMVKDESLPNIKGTFYSAKNETDAGTGCIKYIGNAGMNAGTYALYGRKVEFDASRSSSTYQNNAPVQQEAIQYPYVIVVNTGVEEAKRPINNYQVNNVYSYGISQYYKGVMNNNSWLRSSGQWNSGTVYNGVYEWAVGKLNEKVYDPSKFTVVGNPTITSDGVASGFSKSDYVSTNLSFTMNDSTKTFVFKGRVTIGSDTTTDYQSIFNIGDTDFFFVLKKNSLRCLNKGGSYCSGEFLVTASVTYDFIIEYQIGVGGKLKVKALDDTEYTDTELYNEISWTGTTNTILKYGYGSNQNAFMGSIDIKSFSITVDGEEVFSGSKIAQADGFKKSVDSDITDYDWVVNTEEQTFRLPIKNGQEGVFDNDTVPSSYNLYYYIGDTLQNADLINIARLGEELVDIKSTPHIVETYVNGTSGYRIWSKDSTGYRYCEQWGMTNLNVNNADFTFGIPMKDTNYIVTTALYRNSDGDTGGFANVNIENVYKKTTGIHISQTAGGLATMWKASGYAAD